MAYNSGPSAANLGYENIRITAAAGAPVELYSYDHLKHEANKQATFARIGLVVGAALNGYANVQESRYSPVAAAIDRRTDAVYAQGRDQEIQEKLNATMERLDGAVLQTTTIDPGEAAGGEVVAGKPKLTNGLSPRYDMAVSFNGESHLISFYAAKEGVAVPAAEEYVPTSAAHIRSLMSGAEQTASRSTPVPDDADPQQPGDDPGLVKARDQRTVLTSQTSRPRRHTPGLVILGGGAQ